MKHILEYEEFLNESQGMTYRHLEDSLYTMLSLTGIQHYTYNNELSVSASGWRIGHPDGSIGTTFWMPKLPPSSTIKNLNKAAKKWAKDHNLILMTFYPNGPEEYDRSKEDWSNKAAFKSKYVYGLTFTTPENYTASKVYSKL